MILCIHVETQDAVAMLASYIASVVSYLDYRPVAGHSAVTPLYTIPVVLPAVLLGIGVGGVASTVPVSGVVVIVHAAGVDLAGVATSHATCDADSIHAVINTVVAGEVLLPSIGTTACCYVLYANRE